MTKKEYLNSAMIKLSRIGKFQPKNGKYYINIENQGRLLTDSGLQEHINPKLCEKYGINYKELCGVYIIGYGEGVSNTELFLEISEELAYKNGHLDWQNNIYSPDVSCIGYDMLKDEHVTLYNETPTIVFQKNRLLWKLNKENILNFLVENFNFKL